MSNYKVNGVDLDAILVTPADIDWAREEYASGVKIFSYGYGATGANGDSTTNSYSSPIQVGALTDWSYFDRSYYTCAAIKTTGTLWTWGDGSYGQLGNSAITSRSSPVQVGALTNWKTISISTGGSAIAVKTNNTLWSWGSNNVGQLGSGTVNDRSSPVQVGALTNWKQAIASDSCALATKTDGSLWGWGNNDSGYLTAGADTTPRSSPIQIGASRDWDEVIGAYSLAAGVGTILKKLDGSIWGLGQNTLGWFGQNNTTTYTSPVKITGPCKDVSADSGVLLFIKPNGTLWACGSGTLGSLGNSASSHRSSPVQVGSGTDWIRCFAHDNASFGIRADGTLWAWGYGNNGITGLGIRNNRSSPVQVGTLNTWLTPYTQVP